MGLNLGRFDYARFDSAPINELSSGDRWLSVAEASVAEASLPAEL